MHYQLELEGTHENDLTDELVKILDNDYDKKNGIYNSIFGEICEVAAHSEDNTIVLCGCIIADTKKRM